MAALVIFQFAAGFYISPSLWVDAPLPVDRDSADLPYRRVRQAKEGVSEARFTDTGARFAGELLPGAPVYAVIGDSHVLARNVNDEEAMGFVAQRLARQSGFPINIREIGRSGGEPADYAVEGPAILARWDPVLVFVVLSQQNFDQRLDRGRLGRIEITGGRVRIVPNPPHVDRRLKSLFWKIRNTGTLTEVLLRNPVDLFHLFLDNSRRSGGGAAQDAEPRPDPVQVETAIAGLKEAYGQKLVVMYHPDTGTTGGDAPDARENSLASACRNTGVPFVSLRAAMIAERERNHHFPTGFTNTRPGAGHLNEWGHRVAGEAIWTYIALARAR